MLSDSILRIDDELVIDQNKEEAFINGAPAGLTPVEFSLLNQLARHAGQALSRSELAEGALGSSTDTRSVDSHLKNVRKKLHENARAPKWIKTVRGIGYRLDISAPTNGRAPSGTGKARKYSSADGAGILIIDSDGRRVLIDGDDIRLTSSEYEVLLALSNHPGDVIGKEELSIAVTGIGFLESGRLLASHIKNLRAKMGDDARKPHWIETRHGVGFRFIGTPLQVDPEAESASALDELQRALDEFLNICTERIAIWDDARGLWQTNLAALTTPEDTEILDEEQFSRFAVLSKVNELGPDERLVIYRKKRAGIDDADWLADVESYADHFSFFGTDDLAHNAEPPADNSASPPDDASAIGLLELEHDWYSPEAFQSALTKLSISLSLRDLSASRHGYRFVDDCILSRTWSGPAAYYRTLLDGAVILHESIPQDIRSAGSFKRFCAQEVLQGRLFDYDEDTWITIEGLKELEIDSSDLDAFACETAQYSVRQAVPQFTLPLLRSCASHFPLLKYELSDQFYESVLASRKTYVSRSRLGERSIFAPAGTSARGRDLISSIVHDEGSLSMDDLTDMLHEDYGLTFTEYQLNQLVRAANLFYSPELDRVYSSHAQFVREVE